MENQGMLFHVLLSLSPTHGYQKLCLRLLQNSSGR